VTDCHKNESKYMDFIAVKGRPLLCNFDTAMTSDHRRVSVILKPCLDDLTQPVFVLFLQSF